MPVLEGALERSIALAASMDSRGYGRRGKSTGLSRRLASTLLLAGIMVICVGLYLLLDGSNGTPIGLPMMAVGSLGLAGSIVVGGRHSTRTRYRPDQWKSPEWLVAVSGGVAVALMFMAGRTGADLNPSTNPLELPTLSFLSVLAVLVGITPAIVTPLQPSLVNQAPLMDQPLSVQPEPTRKAEVGA